MNTPLTPTTPIEASKLSEATGSDPIDAVALSRGLNPSFVLVPTGSAGREVMGAETKNEVRTELGAKPLLAYDDFARPNTSAGDAGVPVVGGAWDMRGAYAGSYPLPAATAGQIVDGVLTIVPDGVSSKVFYATQVFESIPRRMGMVVSFAPGGGAGGNSVAMAWSTDNKFIDNMVHCVLNRTLAKVEVREAGGAFTTLLTVTYPTTIASDADQSGEVFWEVELFGNTAVMTVTHSTFGSIRRAVTDDRFLSTKGPYCFWEIIHDTATPQALASLHQVWAAEDFRGRWADPALFPNITFSSLSTGGTTAIPAPSYGEYESSLHNSNGATIASHTFTLPSDSASSTGQIARIATRGEITSTSFSSSGATIFGAPTTMSAGSGVAFQKSAAGFWTRIS